MAYQVNPGTTGNMSDGGEYDNFDEVTSAQYPNAAAKSASEAAASAAQAAASVAEIGNELELAQAAADAAQASASSASTSATNAGNSATSASNSATSASTSATTATTKASEAATSATSASASAATATTQAASASASATSASTSATTATTKASEASTSASNAATSATTATTKASEASSSATSAAASASTATTQASNASTSATNAANSATSASTSADTAIAYATTAVNASTSATNSATAAGASATSASNSATAASGSATAAYNSAVSAGTSATNASNSATSASNSATASATSATNSANSATASATSATNSQTSASASSNSATNAATSASAASTSATNSANSAASSLTSANNAASSETAAASSATSAASSATSAANLYDSFDDRYLGAKTTDPTVDNDGNALIVGALYFNSVSNSMKVYSGSSWVNTAGVASGGTTGQVLSKASNNNYDTTWVSLTGGLIYNGSWNASTNTPALSSGVGTQGSYYVVSVSGNTNLDGVTDWVIGDWAIFNGTIWQKIDQTNLVTSVAGRTGNVTLAYADISGLDTAATQPTSAFATAAQGATADTAFADRLKWDGGATGLTASTGRTSLGLGTIATQDANNVAITGGTITGLSSALPIGSGGTGQTNATAAFNALAPSQASNANKFLKSDGTNPSWVAVSEVPSQTSQAGKYLTTDGTTASWSAIASPNQSYTRTAFTATAGQTVFTVTYTSGTLQVYLNGVLLNSADYTATNGTSFTLASAANVDDLIEAVVFNTYAVGELPASGIVGAVPITSGGTGATTAANALTNLGAIGDITSNDGSVVISTTGTTKDLSVGIAGSTATLISQVRNQTGATLTKGTVVYISGASGNKALVSKALANADSTSAQTYGVVQADIANNNNGYVVVIGVVSGLNTSAFAEGVQLYLSPTTAGTYTSTKPYAPSHIVYVGVVTRSHATQGTIEIKIQNGYEMDELHDVSAQTPSNGNTLVYNSSNSLWESTSTLSGSYTLSGGTANGVTYLNGSKVLTSGSALTFNGTTLGVTGNAQITTSAGIGYLEAYGGSSFKIRSSGTMGVESGAGSAVALLGDVGIVGSIGGSEQMRLTSTGLGIGTSSPSEKLHVNSGTGNVPALFESTDPIAVVQFKDNNSTLFNAVGVQTNSLIFYSADNINMRLDNSGNLGLGVTPSAWGGFVALQVSSGFAAWSSGVANARMNANTYYNGGYKYMGTGRATMYEQDGYHAWYNSASGTANGTISFTQAMTLDVSGNLGIGTTSPATKLQVQSGSSTTNVRVVSEVAPSLFYSGFEAMRSGVSAGALMRSFRDGSNGGVGWEWLTTADNGAEVGGAYTSRMVLDRSGNLGIGTTSPIARLHVNSTSSALVARFDTTQSGGAIAGFYQSSSPIGYIGANGPWLGNSSSDMMLAAEGGKAVLFYTNGSATERARITLGGALVVGTTAPQISTNIYATGNSVSEGVIGARNGTGNSTFQVVMDSNNNCGYLGTSSPNGTALVRLNGEYGIQFTAGGTERARVNSDGNLLVGTTSNSGSISNGQNVFAGVFRTATASVATTNNTTTTILTLPSIVATYMITAWLVADDAVNYSSTYLVQTQGGGSVVTTVVRKGNLLAISNSGYNIQVNQNSGASFTVNCSVLRIA